jgi:hypothetical protein
VLTYALFARLFREDLRKVGAAWLLQVAQASCVAIFAAALALPFAQFLPVMWATVGVGVAVIVFFLVRILMRDALGGGPVVRRLARRRAARGHPRGAGGLPRRRRRWSAR